MVNYVMEFGLDFLREYSDEDIQELVRRNPPMRFERTADGKLLVSPPAGFASDGVNTLLIQRLANWNERFGNGGRVAGSSAGFRLPDTALFAPDASWLSAERFVDLRSSQSLKTFARMCPNLVFEVASHSDRLAVVRRKIESYIRNGAACAVLIDPEDRVVEVSDGSSLHAGLRGSTLTIPVALLAGALAPFELDLNELFAAGE
ncbi:MAG: Uma2 family endonuclease [Candidatus Eremiobacteraeota bacterium]|nr:Uma2 family endonuclease [Candidatus Eremiobacteraeota bacterium]